jgi:CubicO group peptidase (beta-lactamase class C family)
MIALRLGSLALVALCALGTAGAQASRQAPGFDRARLARIDSALQSAVADSSIAGAVALVLRNGNVAYQGVAGWADRESGRRMRSDDLFRIASQTKAVTSVAIMMLVEQGRLGLGDPVSRYMPTFANSKVALRSDSGRTQPARRGITIRDLLTHTAGISYGTEAHVAASYEAKGLGPAAGYGWYTADKDEPICETMDRLGTLPFVAQPGAEWVYGYNTDILGCVVERVSGLTLAEFFRRYITAPLGMSDTFFYVPESKRPRLTTVYASSQNGKVSRAPDGARGQGHYASGPQRSYAGGAGLVSTARDYARFLQMLLNEGELDGVRLLSPLSVRLMSSGQIGSLFPTPGSGFGLGFSVVERPGADGLAPVGTYGWGGAYATGYSVDPAQRIVIVFMTQMLPNGSTLPGRFRTLVYQALVNPR